MSSYELTLQPPSAFKVGFTEYHTRSLSCSSRKLNTKLELKDTTQNVQRPQAACLQKVGWLCELCASVKEPCSLTVTKQAAITRYAPVSWNKIINIG